MPASTAAYAAALCRASSAKSERLWIKFLSVDKFFQVGPIDAVAARPPVDWRSAKQRRGVLAEGRMTMKRSRKNQNA
jgi:hypothetical protein